MQGSKASYQTPIQKLRRNKSALVGIYILATLFVMAIIGPYLSNWKYFETHLSLKNMPPSLHYIFGTDELGRSIFVRIFWGARISLFIGITAAFIDVVIGVFYGAFAGYIGGKTEEFMMRVADILYSLPYLLIVILLLFVMGPGMITIIIAMTITGWINMARIIRSQILQIKQSEFVLASKCFGASNFWIITKHLIPNTLGTIITTMTLSIPTAIFTEAFLSFLGLGIQAPMASWGSMANDGISALHYYPWRLFIPAIFISITMLSFNLLGDGLRDAYDPRLDI